MEKDGVTYCDGCEDEIYPIDLKQSKKVADMIFCPKCKKGD